MKGKTIFILPCDTEVILKGVLKVALGEDVLIDSEQFGNDPLKCDTITHQLIREGNVHRYIQRVFLK